MAATRDGLPWRESISNSVVRATCSEPHNPGDGRAFAYCRCSTTRTSSAAREAASLYVADDPQLRRSLPLADAVSELAGDERADYLEKA